MMSSAASRIQMDPALLTKKLTIVAAVAISATALYLMFGGTRKRTKNNDENCFVCLPDSSSSCQGCTSAAKEEQFQDIIIITTDHEENNVTEAYRCPQKSKAHCDVSLNSSSSGVEASSAASGRRSSPERACSPATISTSIGVCTDPVCFRDQAAHGICCSSQTSMSSYDPDESSSPADVCNCCGETLQQEQPSPPPPNTSFSDKHKKESRVKERKNIPPPSRPYLDMVSGSAMNCEGSHYVHWRDVDSCLSNLHSQEMCTADISNSQCEVCMNNNCEKCRLIGCDVCFPNAYSSDIFTSQKPDSDQRYGTNSSSSPLQQKKKVRWTPNTVEPSCDNEVYRRRQQRYTSYSVVPVEWPVTSYACEQPRLQSQAAKNTITGTRETVRKQQYNY
ncbi:hypothetical protein CY35_11G028700 [Sphagnum magellanicum]|nr:hypothetical protein CY35_11G028700 [Sphagnum magellanicum]